MTEEKKLSKFEERLKNQVVVERIDRPFSYYVPPIKSKPCGLKSKEGLSEEQVITKCKKYMEGKGWILKRIYTGGIPVGSGKYVKNPAKGIPDFLCFNIKTKKTVWIEFKKSSGGVVSPEQKDWNYLISTCSGTIWTVNSLELLKSLEGAL